MHLTVITSTRSKKVSVFSFKGTLLPRFVKKVLFTYLVLILYFFVMLGKIWIKRDKHIFKHSIKFPIQTLKQDFHGYTVHINKLRLKSLFLQTNICLLDAAYLCIYMCCRPVRYFGIFPLHC